MKARAILETIVYGTDISALRHFYETILGLRVRREFEDQFVFLHCGEGMLLVFNPLMSEAKPRSASSAPPHGGHGPGHVCFAASATRPEPFVAASDLSCALASKVVPVSSGSGSPSVPAETASTP